MKEHWINIVGFEGLYQISNLGNIKSLKRTVYGLRKSPLNLKERILSKSIDGKGYLVLSLSKNGESKRHHVHLLMAKAFLGHKPNGHKLIIDHINNIKTDNRVENLQIITNRENASKDRFRQNYSSKYVGVFWNTGKKRWTSKIRVLNKIVHLGHFVDETRASIAYNFALFQLNKLKSMQL